jgi:hypothetical protein
MNIDTRIDSLISDLNKIRSDKTNASSETEIYFESILENALNDLEETEVSTFSKTEVMGELRSASPEWVNKEYAFDVTSPRRPNMREMMEALSGMPIEDLYSSGNDEQALTSHRASELLYDVVNTNTDPRDWNKIMSSSDVLAAAREATHYMNKPRVEIVSVFDNAGNLHHQRAMITKYDGSRLTVVPENIEKIEETLRNFGAKTDSIPNDLLEQADNRFFSSEFLDILTNFKA